MEKNLQQIVAERLSELPENVRQAIRSAEIERRIQEIGKASSLHVDQLEPLQDEVLLVMLGFSDPAEFPDQLQKRLNLSPEQAAVLAENIGTEIFETIRESMQKFMDEQARKQNSMSQAVSGPQPPGPGAPGNISMTTKPSTPSMSKPVPPPPAAGAFPPKPPAPPSAQPPRQLLQNFEEKLLSPSTSTMKKVDVQLPSAPIQQRTTNDEQLIKKYKQDPYREPIE